jgi:transposase
MFGFGPATRIYVAVGATDMRKNYEGLYGLVVTACNARR